MLHCPVQASCFKTNQKYLTLDKAKLLGNAFIDSQFNYAPLIWMFCHETTFLKMQKIHKSLKVIYQSDASYDLLQLSNSVSLHQRLLQFLLTEIYESTGTLNLQFMWSYFKYRKVPYDLRQGPVLFIPPTRSTIYGTNSAHFLGPLTWNRLSNLVKSSRSISEFKNVIKKIGNIDCGCIICSKQHTLSEFSSNSCSSLCSLGSCSHQPLDSLQYPIGRLLYDR